MLIDAVNPLLNAFITVSARYIKDDDDSLCLFVEVVGNSSESLLACGVPDFYWYFHRLVPGVVNVGSVDRFKA